MTKIGSVGNPTYTYSEVYAMDHDYGYVEGLVSTCLGQVLALAEPEYAWTRYCAELLCEKPETLVIDSVVPAAVIDHDIVFKVTAHCKD